MRPKKELQLSACELLKARHQGKGPGVNLNQAWTSQGNKSICPCYEIQQTDCSPRQ